MKITLTREQLESFAKQVYELGVYGYLDLKDSTCDKLVDELCEQFGEIQSKSKSEIDNSISSTILYSGEFLQNQSDNQETHSYNWHPQIYFTNNIEEEFLRRRSLNFSGNNSERL